MAFNAKHNITCYLMKFLDKTDLGGKSVSEPDSRIISSTTGILNTSAVPSESDGDMVRNTIKSFGLDIGSSFLQGKLACMEIAL